jgi:hypothetical protein
MYPCTELDRLNFNVSLITARKFTLGRTNILLFWKGGSEKVYKSCYPRYGTLWRFKFFWYVRQSVYGHIIRGICGKVTQLRQLTLVTHLENWSRLEARGVMHVFWARKIFEMLWFPCMNMPESTRYIRLGTCCIILFGSFGTPPPLYRPDFPPSDFHLFFALKLHLVRTLFQLRWRRQKRYRHVADATETYVLCVRDGQTSQTLWQVPQPCVLSASSIKVLPFDLCVMKSYFPIHLHTYNTILSHSNIPESYSTLLLSLLPSTLAMLVFWCYGYVDGVVFIDDIHKKFHESRNYFK